jgi:hypothetical protein
MKLWQRLVAQPTISVKLIPQNGGALPRLRGRGEQGKKRDAQLISDSALCRMSLDTR